VREGPTAPALTKPGPRAAVGDATRAARSQQRRSTGQGVCWSGEAARGICERCRDPADVFRYSWSVMDGGFGEPRERQRAS